MYYRDKIPQTGFEPTSSSLKVMGIDQLFYCGLKAFIFLFHIFTSTIIIDDRKKLKCFNFHKDRVGIEPTEQLRGLKDHSFRLITCRSARRAILYPRQDPPKLPSFCTLPRLNYIFRFILRVFPLDNLGISEKPRVGFEPTSVKNWM